MQRKLIVVSAGLFVLVLVITVLLFFIDQRHSASIVSPLSLTGISPQLSGCADTEAPCGVALGKMPDLLVQITDGFGGIGALTWDEKNGRYDALSFDPHAFVIDDSGVVRAMRSDETGGTMAVITALTKLGDRVYADIPSYSTIVELAPDLTIKKQVLYGTSGYGGGLDGAMWAFPQSETIAVFSNREFVTFDAELNVLDRIALDTAGPYLRQFSRVGDRLYFADGIDTGPYTSCVATESGDRPQCGERFSVSGYLDLRDPRDLQFRDLIKAKDEAPVVSPPMKAYDSETNTWLFIYTKTEFAQPSVSIPVGTDFPPTKNVQLIEVREAANIHQVRTRLTVPEGQTIVGLTDVAPFHALVRSGDQFSLVSVLHTGETLSLAPALDLEWALPSYQQYSSGLPLHRFGNRLILAVDKYLRTIVFGPSSQATLEIKQDFVGSDGQASLTITNFIQASDFFTPVTTADEKILKELLTLDYYDPIDRRRLENQVSKLTPTDTWAAPLLTMALHKKGGSIYTSRPFFIQGLGNIGEAASGAIPILLDATMEGSGILGDTVTPVKEALKKIDPTAEKLILELAPFEARQYEAGAKYVSKTILEAYTTPAAKEALRRYSNH